MANANGSPIREDMIFKLSSKRSPSEVKLKSLEWAIVTQLNSEKTVGQIADILALNMDEARVLFTRLMKEGLLDPVDNQTNAERVPASVIDDLEKQFTFHVGPVASIVLEDTLAEFKRHRENLEIRQFPLLIELLTLEISNLDKRYEFQKRMLEKIRGMM